MQSNFLTVDTIKKEPEVHTFILQANANLKGLGYTEHGVRHATIVGRIAEQILRDLNYPTRSCELANIAGYLHDIGNFIHRENHALSGSLIAWQILSRLGIDSAESAMVMNAIGNHEEERGHACNAIAAALIIADKSDVHRSRVQNHDPDTFDIHDRVNYATTHSEVIVKHEEKTITILLTIDTAFAPVIEYFEIFLARMTMVKQATNFLGHHFRLIINDIVFS